MLETSTSYKDDKYDEYYLGKTEETNKNLSVNNQKIIFHKWGSFSYSSLKPCTNTATPSPDPTAKFISKPKKIDKSPHAFNVTSRFDPFYFEDEKAPPKLSNSYLKPINRENVSRKRTASKLVKNILKKNKKLAQKNNPVSKEQTSEPPAKRFFKISSPRFNQLNHKSTVSNKSLSDIIAKNLVTRIKIPKPSKNNESFNDVYKKSKILKTPVKTSPAISSQTSTHSGTPRLSRNSLKAGSVIFSKVGSDIKLTPTSTLIKSAKQKRLLRTVSDNKKVLFKKQPSSSSSTTKIKTGDGFSNGSHVSSKLVKSGQNAANHLQNGLVINGHSIDSTVITLKENLGTQNTEDSKTAPRRTSTRLRFSHTNEKNHGINGVTSTVSKIKAKNQSDSYDADTSNIIDDDDVNEDSPLASLQIAEHTKNPKITNKSKTTTKLKQNEKLRKKYKNSTSAFLSKSSNKNKSEIENKGGEISTDTEDEKPLAVLVKTPTPTTSIINNAPTKKLILPPKKRTRGVLSSEDTMTLVVTNVADNTDVKTNVLSTEMDVIKGSLENVHNNSPINDIAPVISAEQGEERRESPAEILRTEHLDTSTASGSSLNTTPIKTSPQPNQHLSPLTLNDRNKNSPPKNDSIKSLINDHIDDISIHNNEIIEKDTVIRPVKVSVIKTVDSFKKRDNVTASKLSSIPSIHESYPSKYAHPVTSNDSNLAVKPRERKIFTSSKNKTINRTAMEVATIDFMDEGDLEDSNEENLTSTRLSHQVKHSRSYHQSFINDSAPVKNGKSNIFTNASTDYYHDEYDKNNRKHPEFNIHSNVNGQNKINILSSTSSHSNYSTTTNVIKHSSGLTLSTNSTKLVRDVKQAYQCHECGEVQDFNDDVEYLLAGIKASSDSNNTIAMRCLSLLSLANKCLSTQFQTQLRARGFVTPILKSFKDMQSDNNLCICMLVLYLTLTYDKKNHWELLHDECQILQTILLTLVNKTSTQLENDSQNKNVTTFKHKTKVYDIFDKLFAVVGNQCTSSTDKESNFNNSNNAGNINNVNQDNKPATEYSFNERWSDLANMYRMKKENFIKIEWLGMESLVNLLCYQKCDDANIRKMIIKNHGIDLLMNQVSTVSATILSNTKHNKTNFSPLLKVSHINQNDTFLENKENDVDDKTLLENDENADKVEQNLPMQTIDLHIPSLKAYIFSLENILNVSAAGGQSIFTNNVEFLTTLLRLLTHCTTAILPTLDSMVDDTMSPQIYPKLSLSLAILKLLLNITHENEKAVTTLMEESLKMSSGGIEIFNHFTSIILAITPDKLLDINFDFLVLILCFMINLIEHSNQNNRYFITQCNKSGPNNKLKPLIRLFFDYIEFSKQAENVNDTDLMDSSTSCNSVETPSPISSNLILQTKNINPLSSSIDSTEPSNIAENDKFVENTKNESSIPVKKTYGGVRTYGTSEKVHEKAQKMLTKILHRAGKHMEYSLIAAYISLFIGCLIQNSEENRKILSEHIYSHLSEEQRPTLDKNPFTPLIEILGKFLTFVEYSTACGVSSIKIDSITRIIETFKKS